MVINLLKGGLILIPFYELLLRVFPYTSVLTPDTRVAKEYVGIWLALIIGLTAIHFGVKRVRNKWLLVLMGYLLLSTRFAMRLPLVMNDVPNPHFGIWKPLFMALAFFLMFVGVQSIKFTRKNIDSLLSVMVWVGFAMSVYAIIQSFGIDQFYFIKPHEMIGSVVNPQISGTLGQPTILGAFIAFLVPLGLYSKHRWRVIPMITAVCLTKSNMAIGAMVVSILIYAVMIRPRFIYPLIVMIVLSGIMLRANDIIPVDYIKAHHNGRFPVWKQVVHDWKNGPDSKVPARFSLTGIGLGRHIYVFPKNNPRKVSSIQLPNVFQQAHNDPLQVLEELGLFGFIIFMGSIITMMVVAFKAWLKLADYQKTMIAALMASFTCLFLNSLGMFVWQLGLFMFFTTVIVGLLHNKSILYKEELQCSRNY